MYMNSFRDSSSKNLRKNVRIPLIMKSFASGDRISCTTIVCFLLSYFRLYILGGNQLLRENSTLLIIPYFYIFSQFLLNAIKKATFYNVAPIIPASFLNCAVVIILFSLLNVEFGLFISSINLFKTG